MCGYLYPSPILPPTSSSYYSLPPTISYIHPTNFQVKLRLGIRPLSLSSPRSYPTNTTKSMTDMRSTKRLRRLWRVAFFPWSFHVRFVLPGFLSCLSLFLLKEPSRLRVFLERSFDALKPFGCFVGMSAFVACYYRAL